LVLVPSISTVGSGDAVLLSTPFSIFVYSILPIGYCWPSALVCMAFLILGMQCHCLVSLLRLLLLTQQSIRVLPFDHAYAGQGQTTQGIHEVDNLTKREYRAVYDPRPPVGGKDHRTANHSYTKSIPYRWSNAGEGTAKYRSFRLRINDDASAGRELCAGMGLGYPR